MTAGLVDGQQIDYYDSVIRKAVQKAQWISGAVDPDYWNRNTQIYAGNEPNFKENINIAKKRFNQTGGKLTYSCRSVNLH
ncbi:Class I histocompatibility antigen, F10 alpha chain [Labeo rohita]|uniref:Class I histocompatibility antigen, F10 alpha chain n=1 Tax=Labeo rohita TaxID=84645 RepID=A0ABQ8LBQ4_LABRO|nr:Class I histocompatibility antigen, F10 alpha chain [Labeo rohita]